jgi:hypothetical protein
MGYILCFLVGTGGIMTLPSASRVAELLRARYPDGDIDVMREPDSLRVEVHPGNGSSLFAVIGDERSLLLAVLGASPDPPS